MTILYSEPILANSWMTNLIGVMFIVAAIFILVLFFIDNNNDNIKNTCLIISFIIMVICRIVGGSDITRIDSNRLRYEVTLNENYPLEDIYDNYNIIEHKGDIWILEDKEPK